jgi:hypothetical protein
MAIVLNLAPEQEARLREGAAQAGLSVEEFTLRNLPTESPDEAFAPAPGHSPQVAAILAFAARLRAGDPEALRIRAERNARVVALLDQWQQEPIDPDEVEGYPEMIPRVGFRQPPFEAQGE